MSDFITFLEKRMREKGFRQKALAEAAGLNETAVRDILKGRSKNPTFNTLKALTRPLGYVSVEEMLTAASGQTLTYAYPDKSGGLGDTGYTGKRTGREEAHTPNVPVFGQVSHTHEKNILNLQASPSGEVLRHPNQYGAAGAFAVYMMGPSMEERYVHGEIIYLHPNRLPAAGKDCLVELQNGDAHVLRFEGQDSQFFTFRKLNPAETLRFKKSDIKGIYAVVGRGE